MQCSGPLFDGRAGQAARDGAEAIRKRLAAETRKLVLAVFTARIKVNHGRFERSLATVGSSRAFETRGDGKSYTLPVVVDDTATDLVVTTDLATYGPWLEGTGSRNETTRFKGYHGFRMAGQAIERDAQALADDAFAPYLERMR